jgi:DNA-binding response OmpR family regulator
MKNKVLLADDDANIRELLGRVLESEHYEVSLARTGREAAAKFLAEAPDLVLLDISKPDKDGWEALQVMNGRHPDVPVIVITARSRQYRRVADFGIDALMEKPLDLPLLLDTIADLLAEPGSNRLKRVTDPGFKTAYLRQTENGSNGAGE